MTILRRAAALLSLFFIEAVAVVTVHGLGGRAPFNLPLDDVEPWLRAAPADALVAALRLMALAFAGWLLLTTVAYAGASAARFPGAVRACEWATPRTIRRIVDRALAASIVVGAVTSPVMSRAVAAVHDPPPRVSVDVRSGKSIVSLPDDRSLPITAAPSVRPLGDRPPSRALDPPPGPPPERSQGTVVVAPGDNLWELAASALARGTSRERSALGADEIARYWRTVCDANRDTLRSGDVDLLYPGEIVTLPPFT